MKNDVWEKAERIFHAALDLPAKDRNLYLYQECAGDTVLASEVESLLSSFEDNSDFLDQPIFEKGLEIINIKLKKNLSGSMIGYYQLQEKIGVGGMGEVYKALDTRLNRRVALKFLSQSQENDHAAKRRLLKEAQAVAMLEHPNICAVHGIEQSDEHYFIVMHYVEGKTLAESIDHETITVETFKSLARQIVGAVAFAHSHGVIHRDLKPGNIMLNSDGQIKVLDFGLAKITRQEQILGCDSTEDVSQFSQNGLIIGTVSYMSPEQLRGEKLDYRSDIFSLGIVLCELLCKLHPFNRKSQAETIAAILNDNPTCLDQFAPVFPGTLVNLVKKSIQKDRQDRFQSAVEMLIELDKVESAASRQLFLNRYRGFFIKIAWAVFVLLVFWSGVFFYPEKRQQKILAVLPISFDNPPPEKEYLAGGLTQNIIDQLSNLSDLKVKNAYFTARYKEKLTDPPTAGKELSADVVLTGSIIQRDNNLFLTTKLFKTSDNVLLDINELKIEEANLNELQEIISTRIISTIKSKLTDDDKTNLAKKDTENAEAKRLFDLGLFYLKRRKENKESDDTIKAIEYFTEAKDLDQNFAKAWANLANAYIASSLPGVKKAIIPEKAVGYAKAAATQALKLDSTLSESYNSLGLISSRYDWNWHEAENYYKTAINLDPEYIPARFGLINVLTTQGRFDESIEEAKKIKEYDPLSISSELELAKIYYRKQEYKQMDKILSDLLERFPDNKGVQYVRSYEFLITGKLKEAADILEKVYNSDNLDDKVSVAAPLGFAYAKMGRRQDTLRIIKFLEDYKKNNYVPAQEEALIYVGLGDYEKVFENLSLSCTEKFQTLPGWVTDPIVNEIKLDARFAGIRRCVNL